LSETLNIPLAEFFTDDTGVIDFLNIKYNAIKNSLGDAGYSFFMGHLDLINDDLRNFIIELTYVHLRQKDRFIIH